MPNTPTLSLPYPVPADSADVPRDIQALALALDTQPSFAPIGAIFLWAVANPPAGWLICNGQLVAAVDYPQLAALLGQSGGNVTLPDLRDRLPIGASATKAIGSQGGEATVVLSTAQMPTHAHVLAGAGAHNHTTDSQVVVPPGGYVFPYSGGVSGTYLTTGTSIPSAPLPVGSGVGWNGYQGSHWHTTTGVGDHVHGVFNTGNGEAHNNLPPYLAMNYIMRAG